MRGLPPLPDDILRLDVSIGMDDAEFSITQHFLAPNAVLWDYDNFAQFNYGWATFCMDNFLQLMPSESGFDVFRLSRFGALPFQYVNTLAENNGAGGDAAPWNAALCLTWRTELASPGARAKNRLPLINGVVTSRKQLLDPTFVAAAQTNADLYILAANNITIAGNATPSFVAVSRVSAGAPRAVATYTPILSGNPSLHVGTLASRTRNAR